MSTVQFTGRSEEDAVRKAAEDLSVKADKVNYKIVSRTSGGLLGMLGQQVVTIEVTLGEPEPVVKIQQAEPEAEAEATPEPSPPAAQDQEVTPKEKAPRPKSDRQARRKKPRRDDVDSHESDVPVEIDEAVFAEKMEKTRQFLADIVGIVGGEAEVKVYPKEPEIHVSLIGNLPDWLSRGSSRTVEALQFVANKVINRFPPRYRVVLITEGKREERLLHLEQATLKLADKIETSGTSAWVVPMNPKERRIVHLAIASRKALTTDSFGDGVGRRLKISKSVKSAE